jgi:iron complex transport system substrate-binding protein
MSAPETSGDPTRIVSLAPSVTDVLAALDLGDRLVGTTRYCEPPESAREVLELGGYLDVNLEAVVGLRPDLVIVIQDQTALRARLDSLGLATLQVDQGSLDGILRSVLEISEACGVRDRGFRVIDTMEARLERVAAMTAGLPPPTALVVVGREAGTGSVTSVWVAGKATFYDDVLRLAGATNAAAPSAVAYPELSREGLLHLDPDVILDLLPNLGDRGVGVDQALADWQSLGSLRAVHTGRLIALDESWVAIPGPRVVDLVERVAGLLHPEVVR